MKQGYHIPATDRREFWRRGTAKMLRPKRVEFSIGNDPDQMFGSWLCWWRWGHEDGKPVSTQGFAAEYMAKCQSGTFVQIVGWDGPEPVAMVELRVNHDAIFDVTTLYGDHAWVHPDYRRGGVMTELVDFCIETARLMGMTKWMVPVTAGDTASAPFLKEVYERAGFRLTGLTMTREEG